jgi:DNA-directed RNA polymerase subunit F
MTFVENLGYILLGFIVIVALFFILLIILEKKLKIRILFGRKSKNEQYIEKLSKVDPKKIKESIINIDKIARAFFIEAFKVKSSLDYSELKVIFNKRHNKKVEDFCRTMTEILYSKVGETIIKKDVQNLVTLLAEIISSNQILSKEEKEELDKKSLEKSGQKPKKKFLFFKRK